MARRTTARQLAERNFAQSSAATDAAVANLGGLRNYMFGPSRKNLLAADRAARDEAQANEILFGQKVQQAEADQIRPFLQRELKQNLTAAGVSDEARFGLGYQSQTAPNVAALESVNRQAVNAMQDPRFSQQGIDMQAAAQEQQMREQMQLAETQANARLAKIQPLMDAGMHVENVRSLKNLFADENSYIAAPGQARGVYKTLRFQIMNAVREQIDAGALQQAEIEFIEQSLPEADAWFGLAEEERMAQLSELEYQLASKLQRRIMTSGTGVTMDQVAGPGRSVKELIAPLPGGLERGTAPQGPAYEEKLPPQFQWQGF